jgi:hypothetical protein
MTKLNHDSELFTSHRHQWWSAEVSKPRWPWRLGRSHAITEEDGAGTVEVVLYMVGGGGAAAPDLVEKEAKRHMVRMVLGGGTADVVRMVWGRRLGERGEYQ